MRPVLEELNKEEAAMVVAKIIRRKKDVSMPELEESFRRSVEACGKSVKRVINTAVRTLKRNGKVKQVKSDLHYNSQKS